jgi:hypothetical protein
MSAMMGWMGRSSNGEKSPRRTLASKNTSTPLKVRWMSHMLHRKYAASSRGSYPPTCPPSEPATADQMLRYITGWSTKNSSQITWAARYWNCSASDTLNCAPKASTYSRSGSGIMRRHARCLGHATREDLLDHVLDRPRADPRPADCGCRRRA